MDLLLQLQTLVVGLLALVVFYHQWVVPKGTRVEKSKAVEAPEAPEAPEPPRAWPIIGHLLQLSTPQPLFRTLAAMAENHGSAFVVRFGVHPTLIISSWELAKECFTTNDKALASRPRSTNGNYLTYDYAMMGFAPYGPYWREVRKWLVLELFSNRRFESLKVIIYTEIDNCMKGLHGLWVKNNRNQIKVEMNQLFFNLSMNVVLKMLVGKSYFSVVEVGGELKEEVQGIHKTMIEFARLTGVSVASDAIPFLRWMGFNGEEKAMKRTAKEMDVIAERWLQEHRQKRECGEKGDGNEQDFMDVMLSILEEDEQFHGYHRDTVVKATTMGIILGATDTNVLSLSWTLSLLLNNQQVLKNAQEEIDKQVGKDRNLDEKDIGNLPYLYAIVKETLRLYPVIPLLIPHETIEDCNVGGFRISSGTRVLVNAWKIHRDPNIWENPLEFLPERFLTSHVDVDVRGQNFELIPFGSGRRSCPATSFALQTMHMILARLLLEFELRTPFDEPVDMSEGMGLTMPKKTPLEVLLTPRVSSLSL